MTEPLRLRVTAAVRIEVENAAYRRQVAYSDVVRDALARYFHLGPADGRLPDPPQATKAD